MSSRDGEKWSTFPTANGHPLLPGLPNDISLSLRAPKLGWRDFYTLSAVSPAWCHAVRSRQVYVERIRSGSTEAFAILCYERFCARLRKIVSVVAIRSMAEDSWFELPPIPRRLGGLNPSVSECIGLDGNVYLLGVHRRRKYSGILDTYVLDLAGQRPWRECAAMGTNGYRFMSEFGILDGKIYSLGGCGEIASNSRGSNQVYDPVKNTWSPIKPMTSLRMCPFVGAMEGEVYVFGGAGCDDYFDSNGNRTGAALALARRRCIGYYLMQAPTTVQIYNPLKDAWRSVVGGFQKSSSIVSMFTAQGKFYAINGLGVHIYDLDSRQFTLVYKVSTQLLGPSDNGGWLDPVTVIAVGQELLAVVAWYPHRENYRDQISEVCIVKCKGIGSKNKTLIWERATAPGLFPTPEGSDFQTLSSAFLR